MKTLLVDDHVLFLEGLRNLLEASGIEVAGTAKNGAEALLKFEMLKPDIVLMDIQMFGCNGIQATQAIIKDYPEAKIIMLTAIEDEENLFAAIQAGAMGYLLKSMEPDQFIRQLAGVAAGEPPLAPGLAGRLLQEFSRRRYKEDENTGRDQRELTERQTQILKCLAEGLTYKEIAAHLNLKEVTVKYHIKEILNKLHLSNRTQLVAHVSRQGIK
jgi:DNA-binding NarL/FixJ family response regulator